MINAGFSIRSMTSNSKKICVQGARDNVLDTDTYTKMGQQNGFTFIPETRH